MHDPRSRLSTPAAMLFFALVLLGCIPGIAQVCTSTSRPHIVFIMMDDLGYGSLGPYFSGTAEAIETPEIQKFVDGVSGTEPVPPACRMTQYYVSSAVCSPSRVAILTGQAPRTFNVRGALRTGKSNEPFSKVGIPSYVATLPEMLRDAGYRTVHVGKWHVGGIEKIADGTDPEGEFTPAALGFDEWWVRVPSKSKGQESGYWLEWVQNHLGQGACINCPDGTDCSTKCRGSGRPEGAVHLTRYFVDRALEVVDDYACGPPPCEPQPCETPACQPLFLNLWLRAPHSPYNSPDVPDTAVAPQRYKGLVEYADLQIGRLLNALQEHLGEETLIFITSDNGAANDLNDEDMNIGEILPNGGLAGKKGSLLEGGLRVPMMIRGPGIGCSENSFPGASFDLLPTLADMLGCDVPEENLLGQSLAAQLADPGSAPRERDRPLFHEGGRGRDLVVRDGRWKYHGCRPHDLLIDMSDCGGGTCDEGQSAAEPFLFNPSCRPNPATVDHPDVLERLQDLFLDWRERSTEVHWTPVAERDDVHLRGQIFEFTDLNGTGGQFKVCSPEGSLDCKDPRLDFHDAAFVVSLKVRPDASGFGNGTENSWLVGKNGSWRLVLTPAGYVRAIFTVERQGVARETFTVTSTEPVEPGRWNHVSLELYRSGWVRADLFLDGVKSAFACDPDPGTPPNPADDEPENCSQLTPPDPLCKADPGVPPDPALDVPAQCSASDAVVSNDKPVIVGAIQNGGGLLERPFYGALSDLRFFTTRYYTRNNGSSPQRERVRRQEIETKIASSSPEGVTYHGDVVSFDAGQVTLCAPDQYGTCTPGHPVFEAADGPWTFSAAVRPSTLPLSGQKLIAGKNDSWRLYLIPGGTLRLQVPGECSDPECLFETQAGLLSAGRWSHLALVLGRGAPGERTLALFLDGDRVLSEVPAGLGGGSKPVVLGARKNGNGELIETFSGDLAGVRLFFDALDDGAISRLGRVEIPWRPERFEGTARSAHGVMHFPQENPVEADQIALCGPDFPAGSGLTGCPAGDYERLDVADGSFTLSVDVRPDVFHPANFARIVGKDGSWQLHRDPNGNLRFKLFTDSGATVTITGLPIPDGVWSTVGFRIEDGKVTIYRVDEELQTVAEKSALFSGAVGFLPDRELVLGSRDGGARFHGSAKNLRLYGRAVPSHPARLLGIGR